MERKFNFSAGPGVLPLEVLEEAQAEMLCYKDAGASIMEISHRSAQYTAVAESARSLFRELLGIGDEWSILFLQGGASLQFYQAPLNFLTGRSSADYVVTGAWAEGALKQAKFVGKANTAASSADENFSYIPAVDTWKLTPDSAYLHVTSNNTIYGTQLQSDPTVSAPMICDASSDFLSRPIEMDKYGMMYAGAQKNIGPAGATVVLVRPDFLGRIPDGLPTLLDYRTHASKLYHTPPVFAVYIIEKVLRWIKNMGGLAPMKVHNDKKAALLYDKIDSTDFFKGVARTDSRSNMNVTFRLPSEELEARFIKEAGAEGLMSLKGHRSAGGIRASIYNACPMEGVQALASFMDRFESQNG
jgi:phosphoserine aminotransferase